MIKLTIWGSSVNNDIHEYDTKKSALSDVKGNGLNNHQYTLEDTKNETTYKSGLWLTTNEMEKLSNGASIKTIKVLRRYN